MRQSNGIIFSGHISKRYFRRSCLQIIKKLTLPATCVDTLSAISDLLYLYTLKIKGKRAGAAVTLPKLPVSLMDLVIVPAIDDCAEIGKLVNLIKLSIKCTRATVSFNMFRHMSQLITCVVSGPIITDLHGLAACKNLSLLKISAISPDARLSDLNPCVCIKYRIIEYIPIRDIAFCLPNLKIFRTVGARSIEISGVSSSPKLKILEIDNSWIVRLPSGTWSRNLTTLNVSGTRIRSIEELDAPNLQIVELQETPIADISALNRCPNLQNINISETYVADIEPLVACQNIDTFTATCCMSIQSAAPLIHLPLLQEAVLCDCRIDDMDIIAATLSARGVRISV